MSIRAVTFDMGGVLRPPPMSVRVRKWEERLGLSEGGFGEIFHSSPVVQQALVGQATGKEMWEDVRCLLTLTPEEWEEFNADIRKNVWWDTELLAFIRELRPQYKTGVISNGTPGTREWVKEYVNSDTFDVIVFSDEEGVAKPDPEIYRRALSRLEVTAEEAIYVDDWLPNVKAAQALGIQAIYCTASLRVREEISRLIHARALG